MKNVIAKVYKDSLAEELLIEVGDKLLSINHTPVKDLIDYRFLMSDDYIEIEIEKPDGEIWEFEIEKEFDEKLGVEFEEAIMDKPMSCHNKCLFCFIDQLPKGMRETLYFKDDDSRLAFLQGNFITLTNMSEEDIDRIIKYRISPMNVSVHTTNPELRIKLTNNKFAGNVYERLTRMAEADIKINCQVVLCPGLNNKDELKRTITDLYKLYPSVHNLAVVPIGVTKHREGLHEFTLFNKESAREELLEVKKLQDIYIKENGSPFVRLADEFYVIAQMDVPEKEFYGDFDQIEDGVGMIRMLREIIKEDLKKLNKNSKGSFNIITGVSGYGEILSVANQIMEKNKNIDIEVIKIKNNFFGETITVAGLLTGGDIIEQVKGKVLKDFVIIPNNMLKKGYEPGSENTEKVFLDNVTVDDMEKILGKKIIITDFSGEDLIDLINAHCKEEK